MQRLRRNGGILKALEFTVDEFLSDIALRLPLPALPPASNSKAPAVSKSIVMDAEVESSTLIASLHFDPDEIKPPLFHLNLSLIPNNFSWLETALDDEYLYVQYYLWLCLFTPNRVDEPGEKPFRQRMEVVFNAVVGASVCVLLHLWEEHFQGEGRSLQQAFNDDSNVRENIFNILNIFLLDSQLVGGTKDKPNSGLLLNSLASCNAVMPDVVEHQYEGKPEQTHDNFITLICNRKPSRGFAHFYKDVQQPGEWKLGAVTMLAQMSSQASFTASGMSLFTSMRGFCRIGCRTNGASLPTLFITENIMPPVPGQQDCTDPTSNRRLVKTMYIFTMKALAVTRSDLFPPGTRDSFVGVLDVPLVSISYTTLARWHLSRFVSLLESAGHWVLGKAIVFSGEWLIPLYSLKFINGVGAFRRMGSGERAWLPSLQFEVGPESNKKRVSFNLQAELVLKTYLDAGVCEKEANSYGQLAKTGFGLVPPFHGIYQNNETGMLGILIGFVGESLRCIHPCDRAAISSLIEELHKHGFHHHDLKPNNIVHGRDGRFRLIDFESVIPATNCKPDGCADKMFLKSLRSSEATGDM